MLDEALALGGRIRVLATFRPSGPSIRRELEALAALRKVDLDIEGSYVSGALDALHAGDGEAPMMRSLRKPRWTALKPMQSSSHSSPWRGRGMRSPDALTRR